MQILIGCAKIMTGNTPIIEGCIEPVFQKNADQIAMQLAGYSADELGGMLHCNMAIAKENVYKRAALRNEQMTIFKEISILSNRKNRFYLVPFSEGKLLYKRVGLCFITALFIHTREGYYALMLTEGPIKLMAFIAHLFHRHKERCDEVDDDSELSGNMIRYALEFMCRNPWVEGKIVPNRKYGEHSLMANITEGVLLGLEHREAAVYKTYLSDDLLREDQTEINEGLKNIRDLHELQTDAAAVEMNRASKRIQRLLK